MNTNIPTIFIRIPRTASRSISKLLYNKIDRHLTAGELKKKTSINDWINSFKFAIVRNPYDRFVSAYYQAGWDKFKDINLFIQEDILWLEKYHKQLFRPQHEFIYEGNKLLVDYVGRFENLQYDWSVICGKIGIKVELPKEPKSKVSIELRTLLDDQSKKFIGKRYARDFELFDYKK